MKTIPLTFGMVAVVDDADYDFVNQWKWHAKRDQGCYYAARSVTVNGKRKTLRLARILAGAAPGQLVDHIDRCTLNNQRANLRVCSQSQNLMNAKVYSRNTSGFKGVSWHQGRKRWRVRTRKDGKEKHWGYFASKEEAAHAYDRIAQAQFQDFALTNKALGLLP